MPTNGSHTICIKEGTVIRLVFTTTDGEYEKKDVDFFDYDISDGKVYSDSVCTQEGDRNSAGELYAKTAGQGINDSQNVSGDGKQYAFGNSNTGTGLGVLERTEGKKDYFNAYNRSGVIEGASFGLVTGMNLGDKTLQWASDIDAPAIFDRKRHSTSDNPIHGKTNYVNDEFSLIFDRDGGTYTLEKVNKGNNTVVDNLDTFVDSFSLFRASNGQLGSGGPWTNSFWPMDYADSYGTNSHDMKFGAGTPKYVSENDKTVLKRPANDKRKYSSGIFPISDDAKDHNSYFGMSFYTDFVVDPGYIAPLRYFFYGDDDLWVFLSETEIDENGNVTGLKNAKLIADIGGVHSSIGEYVNLWDYIEYIPYTKDGKPDGPPNKSKHYRLTFFYTERGASGSSCYMRFSLPFASLVTQPPGYNEMKIEKQVKKSSDSTIDGLNEDDEFAFILHLYNGPIGKEDTKELENGYSYTRYEIINGVPEEVTKTLPYITTGSEFRLKDNEYIEITKLPAETYYRVEELPKIIDAKTGKEKEDKYDFTTLYIGNTEDEDMASSVMREGRATEGTVKEQNWVRFENSFNPGILTLEKKLTSGDAPTSETFSFAVTLKDPEGNPIKNLSWLQYKRDNEETKDDSMVKQQDKASETGEYTFDLAAGEKVMFYDLPKGTKYTITETSRQDYPLYRVTVNEKDVDFTETETGRTINGTINETKIEESQESIFRSDVIFINTQKNSIVELKKEQSLSGQITDDPEGRTTERLTVTEGDTVTYYLTVTNTGENNATDVKVYDEIPFTDPIRLELLDTVKGWHNLDDGKAGTPITGSGGREEDGYKLTWEVGTLEPGKSATLVFQVKTPGVKAYTEWDNEASAVYKGNNPDDLEEPKEIASEKVWIEEQVPDLRWEKKQTVQSEGEPSKPEEPTDATLSVDAGDTVTYYITVTNDGEADAKNVQISDTIPTDQAKKNQLVFVPGSIEVDEVSVADKDAWDEETQTVKWTLDIPSHTSRTLTFQVKVPEIGESTAWKNIAAILTPDEPDKPKPTDPVYVVPHLDIMKQQAVNGGTRTKDPLDVKPGDQVTYYITVENNSEGNAKAVTVTDEIPSDGNISLGPVKKGSITGVVNETGKVITGSQRGNTIYWDAFDLEAGQSAVVEFTVGVPESGHKWINIGYVSYTPDITPDPDDPNPPDPKPTDPEPTNPVDIKKDETEEAPKLSWKKQQTVRREGEPERPEAPTTSTLSVEEGEIVTYYITVTNEGDTDVKGVGITDTILTDLDAADGKENPLVFIEGSVKVDGNSVKDENVWNSETKTIKWTGDVPARTSKALSFQVRVPEIKESTAWKNVAAIFTPDEPDKPKPTDPVYVVPHLDIRKEQSVNGGERTTRLLEVKPEDQVTYYITVENNSEGNAKAVTVTDEIPSDGNIYLGPVKEGSIKGVINGTGKEITGSQKGNTIHWDAFDLDAGQSAVLEFTVGVPESGHEWTNIGYVSYTPDITPDPNDPNQPDPKPTDPEPTNPVDIKKTGEPKLTIRKTQYIGDDDSKETEGLLSVKPGDVITYCITVSNDSDVKADDVIVTDPIPEGLSFVDGSARPSGNVEDGVITWKIGMLEAHSSVSVQFQAKVPEVKETTKWTNIAYVTEGDPDPDPEEPGTPSNEVEAVPGIRIGKTQKLTKDVDGKPTTDLLHVKPDDQVTYYLTVTNTGDARAYDVVVKDTLPTDGAGNDLTLVKGSVKGGEDSGYDEASREITWSLGDLEAGASRTVEFTVTVPEGGTNWINGAFASYIPPDPEDPEKPGPEKDRTPDIPSNEVEIEKTEDKAPAIQIRKTQKAVRDTESQPTTSLLHVKKDDQVTYYLTVTNTGDAPAYDVIVKDLIPTDEAGNQLTLVEGSVRGGESSNYDETRGEITWSLGNLGEGEQRTVEFTVTVPSEGTHWRNIATTSYVPKNPDDPKNPEDPEPERTPDIPSNEVEIEAGTTKLQLRARKVLNGAVLTNGQFTFRIQGISAEIAEEPESEAQKADAAGKAGEDTETPETGGAAEATPSNAERGESETREPGGLLRSGRRTVTEKVLTQARTLEVLVKGDRMRSGNGTVPMPSADTATNNEDGEIVFGEIEYSLPGIYTYKITEVRENRRGYTFDTTEYTVEVVVTRDDATGELRAEARIAKPEGADEILFTNRYRRSGGGGGNPGGGGGSDPQPGPGTDPTPDPTPENPDTPTPENPQPVPDTPVLPDPNDPNSPPTVTIEENGVPRTYVKVWDPVNEEFIYIPEEDVPLFGLLPKTGDEERQRWLRVILALSLAGIGTLTVGERRKRRRRTGDQTES